jgi:hypothetical protein
MSNPIWELTNWPEYTDSGIDPLTGIDAVGWDKNDYFRDVINFEDHGTPGTIAITLNGDFVDNDTIAVAGETVTYYATDAELAGASDDHGISLETSTTAALQATAISIMSFTDFIATNPGAGQVLFTEILPGHATIEEAVVTGTGTLAVNTATAATGDPDPSIFFLLADDVLCLQHAVFAIEDELGLNPGLSTLDPGITNLADRLEYIEDGSAFDTRYDPRYGGVPYTSTYGATWNAVYENPTNYKQQISILGHAHNGIFNAKINLASHVTGVLGLANFDLTAITGTNIWSDSTRTTTIATALESCLSTESLTLQTIDGPTQFNNNFGTLLIKDCDIKDGIQGGYAFSADSEAWSGYSFSGTTATADGTVYAKALSKTKYWRYSIGLRSRVSDISSSATIAQLVVKNTTTGATLKTLNITPDLYNTTNYEIVYTDFVFNGTRPQESISVYLIWAGNGKGVTWKADSISIVPIHLSVYDI